MSSSKRHLIRRNNTWYARLAIPKDVKFKFQNRREFIKSLRTSDLSTAIVRANLLIADWKNNISIARGNPSAIETLAIKLKNDNSQSSERINDDTGMSDKDYYAEEVADNLDEENQKRFYDLYTGRVGTPFSYYVEEFVKFSYINPKTAQDARQTVKLFESKCPTLETVSQKKVIEWVETERRSRGTIVKAKGYLNKYWKYLQDREIVKRDVYPFINIELPKSLKSKVSHLPYSDDEVNLIIQQIKSKNDSQLLALSEIAMYTGARISEICSLVKTDIIDVEGVQCFNIRVSKTKSGIRQVPIHPSIKSLVQKLVGESVDDFLISGIKTKGDYKRRADVVGKRFGRIVRNDCNLPKSKVFHSFRNTVATKLESAGIPENIAADIIGHDKDTMTYGLYSGGTSIKQRYEAIKKISYHL